ncbi:MULTISPECIES: hypothetical protein [unclassified Microcoleus]|uniref:hypothetical protein n=1 Tax=unclassified Microcoleus TaxID=2642155 RepID=UPI001DF20B17|nr:MULTISPECIES: hypothetical protein [unclassified Microcoleus]MCC3513718.1 hypothetical protein [Microcoleus sp. PH2017_17_BER_D_A]MCC3570027.1 hypothetical protein [Microcoleus sp. PH2017_31_RDM_U_A]MCC3582392.1 hypothetical protein [Microcoleus sp. PH2017_32_RDM_D_A]MCC3595117.1 hypothetical protein [Microcoleus sp. PH2017_28_MFU_U_A]
MIITAETSQQFFGFDSPAARSPALKLLARRTRPRTRLDNPNLPTKSRSRVRSTR